MIISRINKQCNSNTYIEKVQKELKDIKYNYSSRENLNSFEYDNFNENIVTDVSDVPIETFKSSNENLEKTLQYDKDLNLRCKSENQINLVPSTVSRSESITFSNDSNTTTLIKSTTTETISEIWKPQVPKTLNIIPLTLNNANLKENECQENDLDNLGDTPKLVRQGSYVLDTPSPILLAHMQMELASSTCAPSSEYVPTSCTNVNRRKEWNVAQAKVEWEYETKNKESVPIANFYSNIEHKMCKSVSLQTKPECSLATYSSTRSADCIQTMLAKEYIDKSDIQINQDKKHTIDNNNEMRKKFQTWNKCNSTFNSCKIGGSLENLNEQNNISTSNNFMEKLSRNTDKNSISRLKSIASDKLLTVYKKVQEMHKKQMAELMFRQHREQTLLQKEFEKQQLLLLIEIKKSFPEVSVSLLSENILSPAFNQIISNDNKVFENNDNMQNVKKVKNNLEDKIEYSQDHMKMISCPLNYIYPEMNYDNASYSTKYSCIVQSSETELSNINNSIKKMKEKDVEIQSNDIKNHKEKLLEETEDSKRSNVSRELFPLDSKTTHVPIPDRTIYETKHVRN